MSTSTIIDAARKAAAAVQNAQQQMQNNSSSQGTGTGTVDYSVLINQAIQNGASAEYVQNLVDQRSEKIASDPTLSQYSGDQTFQDAYNYINEQNAKNQAYKANQLYEQAMSQYEAAQQAQQNSIQASIDQSVNALKSRIPELERQTAEANAGAYNAYLKAANPFGVNAQKEAYLGINDTGYSETNRARLGTTLQGATNENEAQKIALIQDINKQIEEARLSGNIEKANALAAYAQQMANVRIDQGNALLQNSLAQYQQKLDTERYTEQQALNKAETLAAYGDFSGYKAMGYSDEQISNMKSAYDAQMALAQAKATKSTGGGSNKTEKEKINYSGLNDALYNAGIKTEGGAYAYLMDLGLNATDANRYAKYYMDAYNGGQLAPMAESSGFESQWVNQYYQELANSINEIPSSAEMENYVALLEKYGVSEHDINLFMQKLGW